MNEDKTSIEKLANMNLEGLLLPEPEPVSMWWLWIVLALLIFISLFVWVKKYSSPKAVALRSLKQLQFDLKGEGCNPKIIKEQIAVSLRQGFSVARLDNVMPDNRQWRDYLSTLETELYANKASNPQTLSSLITSAQSWLRDSGENSVDRSSRSNTKSSAKN